MKVGDLVKLLNSNGKIGLIVDLDSFDNPIIKIDGVVKAFHYTQVKEVIHARG